MLDATGELIDEVGYEHLTTQQVARRSGVSIGLVYHYFPDRLALVEALIARNSERFMTAVTSRLDSAEVTTWREGLNAVLDVLIELYRHQPGFRKIGLNDRFLTAQSAPTIRDQDNLAAAFLSMFRDRYAPEGPEPTDLLLRFEVAVQMGDALMGRAFRSDRNGEERVLGEARTVLESYLAPFLDYPDNPAEQAGPATGDTPGAAEVPSVGTLRDEPGGAGSGSDAQRGNAGETDPSPGAAGEREPDEGEAASADDADHGQNAGGDPGVEASGGGTAGGGPVGGGEGAGGGTVDGGTVGGAEGAGGGGTGLGGGGTGVGDYTGGGAVGGGAVGGGAVGGGAVGGEGAGGPADPPPLR